MSHRVTGIRYCNTQNSVNLTEERHRNTVVILCQSQGTDVQDVGRQCFPIDICVNPSRRKMKPINPYRKIK